MTRFWQETAVSVNQSSASLFLIPLPLPASTQQSPAHCVTRDLRGLAFPCCYCRSARGAALPACSKPLKAMWWSLPGSLARLNDKVGNCKYSWWKWSLFLFRFLQQRLSLKSRGARRQVKAEKIQICTVQDWIPLGNKVSEHLVIIATSINNISDFRVQPQQLWNGLKILSDGWCSTTLLIYIC